MRNASNSRPVALVTGASSGIGRSLAMQLAERGHDLVLTARRLPLLEEAAEEIGKATGAQCVAIRSDLSDVDGAQQLIAEIRRRNLRVRSEEHTSELQSLMRISYAVFCLKKKKELCQMNKSKHTRRQLNNTIPNM